MADILFYFLNINLIKSAYLFQFFFFHLILSFRDLPFLSCQFAHASKVRASTMLVLQILRIYLYNFGIYFSVTYRVSQWNLTSFKAQ